LQLLPGFDEVEDVDGLAKHLHLLVETRDGEGNFSAALEVGDFKETFLLTTNAIAECRHG
jgi:hypothetical protein